MTISSLRPADRKRIVARLDDLRELDKLMRQPGTLATPPASPPRKQATRADLPDHH